ncbi:fdxB [Gossypium australe]|uniref:FdxB n=1 Tax=Gossypium australe TaxID=47621 RepID=A0A5B6W6Y9_9ROSI|nr:fdxB [Gossypium australe]
MLQSKLELWRSINALAKILGWIASSTPEPINRTCIYDNCHICFKGWRRNSHSRACEGSLACSTCHVIVMDMEYYNKLEDPADEKNDMLDLAFGLTETFRLGCQIVASPELDGIRLAIPAATRNFAVDGVTKEEVQELYT